MRAMYMDHCGRRFSFAGVPPFLSCRATVDNLIAMSNPDLDLIERRIADLVEGFATAPDAATADATCTRMLEATARQAVASSEGGKRLRALLAMDAYAAVGGDDARTGAVRDLACAIEVFQTAALVHDDIIDDSDLRRGRPAAHKALGAQSGDPALGVGLGIMLGDMLATASVDIADTAARALPNADEIVHAFLAMHREVEIGQVLDLAAALGPLDDPERMAATALDVFRWKTASYTTIAPIELAMLAAGVRPGDARERALAIGGPLGLAFQITDDLLDVVGNNTGKPIGGDIREGKRTVLLADALARATPQERDELVAAYVAPSRDDGRVRRVIALFDATGAVGRSRERIAGLWERTRDAIGGLGLPQEGRDRLVAACARFVPTVR